MNQGERITLWAGKPVWRGSMMGDWAMMTGSGIGHWIFFAIMVALILYPVGRILGRIGLSPFWSVLGLIPFVNLIALWVLAFVDWPGRGSPADDR